MRRKLYELCVHDEFEPHISALARATGCTPCPGATRVNIDDVCGEWLEEQVAEAKPWDEWQALNEGWDGWGDSPVQSDSDAGFDGPRGGRRIGG